MGRGGSRERGDREEKGGIERRGEGQKKKERRTEKRGEEKQGSISCVPPPSTKHAIEIINIKGKGKRKSIEKEKKTEKNVITDKER